MIISEVITENLAKRMAMGALKGAAKGIGATARGALKGAKATTGFGTKMVTGSKDPSKYKSPKKVLQRARIAGKRLAKGEFFGLNQPPTPLEGTKENPTPEKRERADDIKRNIAKGFGFAKDYGKNLAATGLVQYLGQMGDQVRQGVNIAGGRRMGPGIGASGKKDRRREGIQNIERSVVQPLIGTATEPAAIQKLALRDIPDFRRRQKMRRDRETARILRGIESRRRPDILFGKDDLEKAERDIMFGGKVYDKVTRDYVKPEVKPTIKQRNQELKAARKRFKKQLRDVDRREGSPTTIFGKPAQDYRDEIERKKEEDKKLGTPGERRLKRYMKARRLDPQIGAVPYTEKQAARIAAEKMGYKSPSGDTFTFDS